ncbi:MULTISPECIES: hypothetical protein [unclassified Luteococcus]|uniref:hypothetical protein n=1 Tax=unclassified Luteococcus TaxID=2639923 RepID=UPI00313B0C9D
MSEVDDEHQQDFSREEELFRQAFARHGDDLADEPIGFLPPADERPRSAVPLAVRWLSVAAALAVIGGGSWAYLNRTDTAVPGPAAPSALPASPSPTPSASTSPTASPSASPSQTPSLTTSPSPAPTAVTVTTAAPSRAGSATPTRTASAGPSATAANSRQQAGSAGPTAQTTAQTTGRASAGAGATASQGPSATTSPSSQELGDANPQDPVPAKADQLTVDTPVTFSGWGAYQLGTTAPELTRRKLIVPVDYLCEGSVAPITAHRTLGLSGTDFSGKSGPLVTMTISNPVVRTDRGVGVGMTLAQVAKAYGDQFAYQTKRGEFQDLLVGRAQQGSQEILFLTESATGEPVKASPTATVSAMVVRPYSELAPPQDAC